METTERLRILRRRFGSHVAAAILGVDASEVATFATDPSAVPDLTVPPVPIQPGSAFQAHTPSNWTVPATGITDLPLTPVLTIGEGWPSGVAEGVDLPAPENGLYLATLSMTCDFDDVNTIFEGELFLWVGAANTGLAGARVTAMPTENGGSVVQATLTSPIFTDLNSESIAVQVGTNDETWTIHSGRFTLVKLAATSFEYA